MQDAEVDMKAAHSEHIFREVRRARVGERNRREYASALEVGAREAARYARDDDEKTKHGYAYLVVQVAVSELRAPHEEIPRALRDVAVVNPRAAKHLFAEQQAEVVEQHHHDARAAQEIYLPDSLPLGHGSQCNGNIG